MRTIIITPLELLVIVTIALMMVLSIVTGSWGDSLTCDCSPVIDMVTGFQLKINEADFIDTPAVLTCGTGTDKVVCTGDSKTICYDLTPLPIGPYTVIGRAVGSGGTSNDSLPFSFTKAGIPSSPLLLRKIG